MHINIGECIEDRARLFSVVTSGRTTGKGHKLKHGRLPLNIRKHFFAVTEHWWYRLLREVMGSPPFFFSRRIFMLLVC